MNKKIYIFSGLGTDERMFQKLDLTGHSIHFIKWIPPRSNEAITDYATRLLTQILTPHPILIGLSFGGIMAIEIAKQIKTEKVILIASVKTKKELPFYYRWLGLFKIHKLVPASMFKNSNVFTNWLFGTNSSFDKQLNIKRNR